MGNFRADFEDPGYNDPDCADSDDCCGSCHECSMRYRVMEDDAERRIELMEMREE